MHLELTELLTCPHCGPPHGLIAFVDRMAERRIVEGHLDCPVCERRHPIREGTVYFDAPSRAGDSGISGGDSGAGKDAAGMAAALLGPTAGPETLLVVGRTAGLAAGIAALRPQATILSFGETGEAGHERVHHFVSADAEEAPVLPVRPGRLDGAVITGPTADDQAEQELLGAATVALRSGARLVRLAPRGGGAGLEPDGLRKLAADERAWVGVRT